LITTSPGEAEKTTEAIMMTIIPLRKAILRFFITHSFQLIEMLDYKPGCKNNEAKSNKNNE
jgi:hypothetical protein